MTVGERIRNRRCELGMTQDELARRVGYKTRSSINKIEMATQLPNAKIEKIAAALGTSPGYLMGWSDVAPIEVPDKLVLSAKQQELISITSGLTNKQIDNVLKYAEFLKGGG